MAKGSYRLIGHDDPDISFFSNLLGKDELRNIFMNDEGRPRSDFMNTRSFFNSVNNLFYRDDEMRLALPYFEHLHDQLIKKIDKFSHKEEKYSALLQKAMRSYFLRNANGFIDLSFTQEVNRLLHSMNDLGASLSVTIHGSDTPIPWQHAEPHWVDVPALAMVKRAKSFANSIFNAFPKKEIPGTVDELISYIVMTTITKPIILFLRVFNRDKQLLTNTPPNEVLQETLDDFQKKTNQTRIVVNILAMTAYKILDEIETARKLQPRSKTMAPDTYFRYDQITRSFGVGTKHKVTCVSSRIRNITYKVWLYYWQHSQPRFQRSSTDNTEELYVTGPEMIMALDEAFPLTRMGSKDSSSDNLASRRNLISEMHKYPSLVDYYFNH
ncbi:hypothetical protein JFQ84_002022 [Aeromonas hydrophila]|nr:hypothetical protein [Aeromonas hydrophila]